MDGAGGVWDLRDLERIGGSMALMLAAALTGLALSRMLLLLLQRLAKPAATPLNALLAGLVRGPLRLLAPLLAVMLVVPSLAVPEPVMAVLKHLFSVGIIAALAWSFLTSALTGRDLILRHFNLASEDNLRARTIHTQLNILVKLVLAAILVVAVASLMMTFEQIRQVGVSILASAGVIGVIVGFAAQRTIATLFAGLQIAFTQPIRLDDVVIVEGEWGRVEEITLTYVVVRIWDLRRLVVPVTYFLEKPFQNWTRTSANLLGTVFLYVDYSVPVDAVRGELQEILRGAANWDRRVCGAQVTNCTERTMELRLLMSAADSAKAFDLSCEVREMVV
jgi:small-conductance mechanosensitive channel